MRHPDNLPFGYSQITKYIYIGTNKCCEEKKFVNELLKKGISADISLEKERIDTPFGVKFFVKKKRPEVHINPIQKKALEKFEGLARKGLIKIYHS